MRHERSKIITEEKEGNKNNIISILIICIIMLVLLLGTVSACIAFALVLSKLENDIQSFQQLNYKQLSE